MKFVYLGLLMCFYLSGFCIHVTHGPVVGAVTDTSCNLFVRTDTATAFTVLLSNTDPFGTILASASGTTNTSVDNTAIIQIAGLSPNTQYYIRLTINGTPVGGLTHFQTLYAAGSSGDQVFLTGADINTLTDADSALFTRAAAEHAKAFIQIGKWGYPDVNSCSNIYLSGTPTSWASTWSSVQNVYKQRYANISSLSFLKSLALDYVYDDDDYVNPAAGMHSLLGYHLNPTDGIYGAPTEWSIPVQARLNCLQGYHQYFPAYSCPDSTNAIYHSFRSGDAEFFVLDARSLRGPNLLHVDTDGNTSTWQYFYPPSSNILGVQQMNWLENALRSSTAAWKFIINPVPFNIANRFALDTLVGIGNGAVPYWNPAASCIIIAFPNTAFTSTNHFADWWSGYKADGDTLLNFVFANNIANVFMISGNSGTVGLDDGVNSGLPELMSGNMKIANTRDALLYQEFMGFSAWDLGGSGLCGQSNWNPTYGKIEVFNDDSIRLSAVDSSGAEVVGANFYANTPYKYNPAYLATRLPLVRNDVVNLQENNSVQINVLANDSDYFGQALYVNLETLPTHGTATVNGDNTITYQPNSGYYGPESFTYTACDHKSNVCPNCATATVTINISKYTGLAEVKNTIRLNVFPNPASNVLFVEAPNCNDELNFQLLNAIGEKLCETNFTLRSSIDVSRLASGYYFYEVRSKDNELVGVGKVSVVR